MKFSIPVTNRKQTASFRIVGLMLAIALLWLATASTSAHAQTSDDDANVGTNTAATTSPGDWTQFRRDNMQRWNPFETVLGVNNVGNLQLKWRQTGNSPGGFLSDPVVANGVLYVNGGDHLSAFNASTGVLLWTYAAAGNNSTPAVANGVVYYASNDGNVYALNARTGAKLWSHDTSFAFPAFDITVANGVVYAGGGIESQGNDLYALDAGTGALLWRYHAGAGISSIPAVANGAVYFVISGVSSPSGVLALNARTGDVLWNYNNGFLSSFYDLVVANGMVYFAGYDSKGFNTMFAVNASSGKTLWTYEVGLWDDSPPAVADGVIYIAAILQPTGSSVYASGVYALNATTGQKLWSNQITENESLATPAVANGVVYISAIAENAATTTSHMYALNASTGAKLWSYPLPDSNPNFPIVTNGTVYFTDTNFKDFPNITTHLYAFSVGADLFLRTTPSATTVHQGDLLTFAFSVWNLGPNNAVHEVLNTQVPAGTTFDYIRISGTPGLGTCTTPPYQGTGQIVCHENSSMAPNTTWTVRLTVKVTAPPGTVITANAATMADTTDPNLANNMATVSVTVH